MKFIFIPLLITSILSSLFLLYILLCFQTLIKTLLYVQIFAISVEFFLMKYNVPWEILAIIALTFLAHCTKAPYVFSFISAVTKWGKLLIVLHFYGGFWMRKLKGKKNLQHCQVSFLICRLPSRDWVLMNGWLIGNLMLVLCMFISILEIAHHSYSEIILPHQSYQFKMI